MESGLCLLCDCVTGSKLLQTVDLMVNGFFYCYIAGLAKHQETAPEGDALSPKRKFAKLKVREIRQASDGIRVALFFHKHNQVGSTQL